jgi:hypothetical protein
MNDRGKRIGVNEALFREVNEQIEQLNLRSASRGPETMQVVCECGNATCIERFEIELQEYERTRKDPRRFLVVPGHEIPDVEIVIERNDAYVVVEKNEAEAEEIAEETDPRRE